ncbi:MAG: hypothetical protein PWQ96_235 [Clostridia bacterium]|nr:hypothetical protein [Clostridia bacterium]
MVAKILFVDDEEKLQEIVRDFLTAEGFEVIIAADGREALLKFTTEKPDLIVLDWMLPELSGLDVCRTVREKYATPIIMLTAKSEEVDKLLGLELGADDYLTKPFSLRELVARIRAVLRRTAQAVGQESSSIIRHGKLAIDTERHQVKVKETPVQLTPTEYKILVTLAQKPGRVFSRLQLLDILGLNYEGYERSLDTHISNLRRKIEGKTTRPKYIKTVYGTGYKMNEEVD